jgi:hypothetical protein
MDSYPFMTGHHQIHKHNIWFPFLDYLQAFSPFDAFPDQKSCSQQHFAAENHGCSPDHLSPELSIPYLDF